MDETPTYEKSSRFSNLFFGTDFCDKWTKFLRDKKEKIKNREKPNEEEIRIKVSAEHGSAHRIRGPAFLRHSAAELLSANVCTNVPYR